jgi:hypothetical protein
MQFVRIVRASLAVAGAALIGFHGWLFAAQFAAGRLEDPWLIFRWIAAAALIAAFVAVRRGGASIWSRKSVAIWVLAALLHGPAIVQSDFNSFALPESVATTVLQLISSAALGISLWMLAGLLVARRRSTQVRYAMVPVVVSAGGLAPGTRRHFSPRPPPFGR